MATRGTTTVTFEADENMEHKCPECDGRLYAHVPSDGGPEPPKRECWDCGWWEPLTDD